MTDSTPQVRVGERNRVRRARERGHYDLETIYRIIDGAVLCHLGYVHDDHPVVTPTVHWRQGEYLYWHGSNAARYMKASNSAPVCITITHLDGLVLARSAFHHSANYRSVMVFGQAEPIVDVEHKEAALRTMIEKFYPDRWETLRPMTDGEFDGTMVARLPISDASAKIRSGPPIDDEEDYALPIWAGVIPTVQTFVEPIEDPRQHPDLQVPNHARDIGERLG